MDRAAALQLQRDTVMKWQRVVATEHALRKRDPRYAAMPLAAQARELASFCETEQVANGRGWKLESGSIEKFLRQNGR